MHSDAGSFAASGCHIFAAYSPSRMSEQSMRVENGPVTMLRGTKMLCRQQQKRPAHPPRMQQSAQAGMAGPSADTTITTPAAAYPMQTKQASAPPKAEQDVAAGGSRASNVSACALLLRRCGCTALHTHERHSLPAACLLMHGAPVKALVPR